MSAFPFVRRLLSALSIPAALLCLLSLPAFAWIGLTLSISALSGQDPYLLVLGSVAGAALGGVASYLLLFLPAKLYFDNIEAYRGSFPRALAEYFAYRASRLLPVRR